MGQNIHLIFQKLKYPFCKATPPSPGSGHSVTETVEAAGPGQPLHSSGSALQGRMTLEERTFPDLSSIPLSLQSITFLPNPILQGTLDENFGTFIIPAVLMDIIAIDNYRKTRVEMRSGEGVNEETLTRFDILFVQFFILHLVSSECSAMHSTIFSLIKNQVKVVLIIQIMV